jgi:hypothetical protein
MASRALNCKPGMAPPGSLSDLPDLSAVFSVLQLRHAGSQMSCFVAGQNLGNVFARSYGSLTGSA